MTQEPFLSQALELAYANSEEGGRPFGAVVVKDGKVIATGVNEMHQSGDPTAHAELVAVRKAGQSAGADSLKGSTMYASGHPCPMCMAAMRMSGVAKVVYAYSNEDGAPYGLSTAEVYEDLAKPFSEQSMEIRYQPHRLSDVPDLYVSWGEKSQP